MLDLTIPQSDILGAHHQCAAACFRHADGYRSRCGASSLIARKPCAGHSEPHSFMRTRSDGRMYCLSCTSSSVESCVGAKVKLLEGRGS